MEASTALPRLPPRRLPAFLFAVALLALAPSRLPLAQASPAPASASEGARASPSAPTSEEQASCPGSGVGLCVNPEADAAGDAASERQLVHDLVRWLSQWAVREDQPQQQQQPLSFGPFEVAVEHAVDVRKCCDLPHNAADAPFRRSLQENVRGHISLYATMNIKPGEPVVQVPRMSIAFRTPTAEDMLPYGGKQLGLAVLASFLLRERAKGSASFWAPYLRTLPERLPTHPLYYDSAVLQEFQCAPFEEEVERVQMLVSIDYSKCENPAAIGNATEEEYKWAYTMVLSRLFSFYSPKPQGGPQGQGLEYLDSENTAPAMVPLGDLIDHSLQANLQWKLDSDALRFYAIKPILAGEPLTHSYGNKSNTKLLTAYGFLFPENPFDGVQLFKFPAAMAMVYSAWRAGQEEIFYFPPMPANKEGYARGQLKLLKAVAERASKVYQGMWKQVEREKKYEVGKSLVDAQSPVEIEGQHAWPGGYLDPEVIAVLASVASTDFAYFRVEPNYGQLSRIALALGWKSHAMKDDCTLIKTLLEEKGDRDALAAAGKVMRLHARDLLEQMGTTLEEDRWTVEALDLCTRGERLPPSSGSSSAITELCRKWEGERLAWYRLALQFRVWKKTTLAEVAECCQWSCD